MNRQGDTPFTLHPPPRLGTYPGQTPLAIDQHVARFPSRGDPADADVCTRPQLYALPDAPGTTIRRRSPKCGCPAFATLRPRVQIPAPRPSPSSARRRRGALPRLTHADIGI